MPFKVHRLSSSSPDLPYLAGKYAALRLSALTTAISAFSSTFAIESTFTATQWIARLTRPNLHVFICAYYAEDSDPAHQTVEQGEWVGKVTILGPAREDTFELPVQNADRPPVTGLETKWQMTALYANPSYRGKRVAKTLINEALEFAHKNDTSGHGTRVRIFVHPSNVSVLKLYENLDFQHTGLCTLAEAYLQNGDASLLPADGGSSDPGKYLTRAGLTMEHIRKS